MISNLDPASQLFLANLDRIQQNISEASQEVSSGKQISVASDSPDQIAPLLQLRSALAVNTQAQSNLTLANTDATAADNALTSAINIMDNAVTIAQQGTDVNADATTWQNLADQVQALQEQMVTCSQATVQGRYIFSGDDPGTPAYVFDLNSPDNAVDQQTTAPATAQVANPLGGTFSASKTAQEIFDDQNPDGTSASDNVFAALNNLRLALLSNNAGNVANTIDSIQQASDHLDAMQSFYGSVETQIQAANEYASNQNTQLQAQISQIQDADVTSAAMELTSANTQMQAAMQMEASLPHTSLFSYLG